MEGVQSLCSSQSEVDQNKHFWNLNNKNGRYSKSNELHTIRSNQVNQVFDQHHMLQQTVKEVVMLKILLDDTQILLYA